MIVEKGAGVLRRCLAACLGLFGLVAAASGVASATVWRPHDEIATTAVAPSGTQVLVVDPGVLDASAKAVKLQVVAPEPVVVAIGRDSDVAAWAADAAVVRLVGYDSAESFKLAQGLPDAVGSQLAASLSPSATPTPTTQSAGQLPVAEGSDLWVSQQVVEGEASLQWQHREGRWCLLIAPAGLSPAADSQLTGLRLTAIRPAVVATPWLWPGVLLGVGLITAAVLLLVFQRRSRTVSAAAPASASAEPASDPHDDSAEPTDQKQLPSSPQLPLQPVGLVGLTEPSQAVAPSHLEPLNPPTGQRPVVSQPVPGPAKLPGQLVQPSTGSVTAMQSPKPLPPTTATRGLPNAAPPPRPAALTNAPASVEPAITELTASAKMVEQSQPATKVSALAPSTADLPVYSPRATGLTRASSADLLRRHGVQVHQPVGPQAPQVRLSHPPALPSDTSAQTSNEPTQVLSAGEILAAVRRGEVGGLTRRQIRQAEQVALAAQTGGIRRINAGQEPPSGGRNWQPEQARPAAYRPTQNQTATPIDGEAEASSATSRARGFLAAIATGRIDQADQPPGVGLREEAWVPPWLAQEGEDQ
ncbi:MAG: hypothetical protein LBG70_03265 [Bifidobacteriaceae bacterium]|nr:hypothetical protein [Bifidobacteriaceae bacterium]